MKVKLLHKEAKIPTRAYSSAGYDLYCLEDEEIESLDSSLINTGVAVAIPAGHVGIVKSKSGLSVKAQLEVGAGVIDSDYRGELMVHIYNHHWRDNYEFKAGDKIAQLLIVPIFTPELDLVDDLDETDRAEKGFGSSGK